MLCSHGRGNHEEASRQSASGVRIYALGPWLLHVVGRWGVRKRAELAIPVVGNQVVGEAVTDYCLYCHVIEVVLSDECEILDCCPGAGTREDALRVECYFARSPASHRGRAARGRRSQARAVQFASCCCLRHFPLLSLQHSHLFDIV